MVVMILENSCLSMTSLLSASTALKNSFQMSSHELVGPSGCKAREARGQRIRARRYPLARAARSVDSYSRIC
jgi:hypothetical protein